MYVLFLDFDGVIVTWKAYAAREDWDKFGHPVDFTTVKFLERFFFYGTQYNDLKLVISSSWRFDENACKAVLEKGGLLKYLHEDWCTTLYPQPAYGEESILASLNRGSEVMEWIKRHPEVKEYRILDDDDSGMEQHKHSYIKCDGCDGLSGPDMRRLVVWITPACKIGKW
jgi:hypothetical protein